MNKFYLLLVGDGSGNEHKTGKYMQIKFEFCDCMNCSEWQGLESSTHKKYLRFFPQSSTLFSWKISLLSANPSLFSLSKAFWQNEKRNEENLCAKYRHHLVKWKRLEFSFKLFLLSSFLSFPHGVNDNVVSLNHEEYLFIYFSWDIIDTNRKKYGVRKSK